MQLSTHKFPLGQRLHRYVAKGWKLQRKFAVNVVGVTWAHLYCQPEMRAAPDSTRINSIQIVNPSSGLVTKLMVIH